MAFTNLHAAKSTRRKNIFISYRVQDTGGETGRLVETLKKYFPADQIFLDIDKLKPGVDFTKEIAQSLQGCDVLLAVIGPKWTGKNELTAESRIKQTKDWVRLEIATALQKNIVVIPVLVDNATLPKEDELPDDLLPLLDRQSHEITNRRWDYDSKLLVDALIELGVQPKHHAHEETKTAPKTNVVLKVVVGVLAFLGLLGIIGMLLPKQETDPVGPPFYVDSTRYADSLQALANHRDTAQSSSTTTNRRTVPEPKEPEAAYAMVDGYWREANNLYTLHILQNGSELEAESFSNAGQPTGHGTGTINKQQLYLTMMITGVGTINIQATVSANKNRISGNYVITNNGASYTEPMVLLRQ